jgi:hypothetical protein
MNKLSVTTCSGTVTLASSCTGASTLMGGLSVYAELCNESRGALALCR